MRLIQLALRIVEGLVQALVVVFIGFWVQIHQEIQLLILTLKPGRILRVMDLLGVLIALEELVEDFALFKIR